MISLQFQTFLLRYKPVWYWEETINRQVEKPYALTVLSAVPSQITPYSKSLNWNLYDARIASDFCPVTKSGINYELIAIGSRWVLRVGFNVDALNKIHAQNFNTTTWSFRVTLSKQNCTKRIEFLAPNYVWTFKMFYLDSRTICHEQDCLTFSSSKFDPLT